jgi:hypothetical protein
MPVVTSIILVFVFKDFPLQSTGIVGWGGDTCGPCPISPITLCDCPKIGIYNYTNFAINYIVFLGISLLIFIPIRIILKKKN